MTDQLTEAQRAYNRFFRTELSSEVLIRKLIRTNPRAYLDLTAPDEIRHNIRPENIKVIMGLFKGPNGRVTAIKYVREITGLGLKQAKEIADNLWERSL